MFRSDIVISVPHAGTEIPEDIRPLIPHDDQVIRNESDLYTDQIFDVGNGVRSVIARHSRIIGDPNRAPDEIYTEDMHRSLGVVMLRFPDGKEAFAEDPSLDTITAWTERFHVPFHKRLRKELKTAKFLIDGHSMWSVAAAGHYGGAGSERADIILGNQYFCTCSAETTQFFRSYFQELGYSVAINDPYPGRYIIGTHCSRLGLGGMQIEINRKLYLNETTLEPNTVAIAKLQNELSELIDRFCAWDEQNHGERHLTDLSEDEE